MTFSNGEKNALNSKQLSYKWPFEGWRQEVLEESHMESVSCLLSEQGS